MHVHGADTCASFKTEKPEAGQLYIFTFFIRFTLRVCTPCILQSCFQTLVILFYLTITPSWRVLDIKEPESVALFGIILRCFILHKLLALTRKKRQALVNCSQREHQTQSPVFNRQTHLSESSNQ
jgi:hypothetical protein